jgi:hypothetical protein
MRERILERRAAPLAGVALALLMLGAVALWPSPADAGTLDQSQTTITDPYHMYFGDPDDSEAAQVFTAGRTGALDQVDVALRRSCATAGPGATLGVGPVGAGGQPYISTTTVSVPDGAVTTSFQFIAIAISPPVPVTAGARYAIKLIGGRAAYCNGYPIYAWAGTNGNPYPLGEAWYEPGYDYPPHWDVNSANDMTFRTYVAPVTGAANGAQACSGGSATATGSSSRDVLTGTAGPDVIAGLGGPDRLIGLAGDDILCGDAGADKLDGGAGKDRLIGGPGRDVIRGNGGGDVLIGGGGDDRCVGGPGKDRTKSC